MTNLYKNDIFLYIYYTLLYFSIFSVFVFALPDGHTDRQDKQSPAGAYPAHTLPVPCRPLAAQTLRAMAGAYPGAHTLCHMCGPSMCTKKIQGQGQPGQGQGQ